jgi:hypothetical protein
MLNIVFELPFFFRPILHNVPKVQVCDVEIFRQCVAMGQSNPKKVHGICAQVFGEVI